MSEHFYGCRSFSRHFDDLMDDTYFEINGQMISYLPKFRGAHVDNPLIHLRDLHIACNTLRPRGVNEADFMLRMFVYSLTGYAKSWLLSLSVSSMPQWEKMRQLFLMEYSIKQHPRETTYEYLERFRDMWDTCPDYSLPDHVVALNFLDGMNSHEREMMDVMAGGEIMECYPEDVWDLIYQRATCTNPNAEPTHYNNAPTRSLEDIVQQLAQTIQQNQGRTDKVLAELSEQISRISEAVFEMDTTISTDNYLDTGHQTESMEEVYENTESKSIPAPTVMDDKSTSNSIKEEEDVQDETCLTVVTERNEDLENHAKDLISSHGIVGTCTTDFLVMPDYSLSTHVQDHGFGVSFGMEKVIILGDDVSSFLRHKRNGHSMFGWKPGWNLWRSVGGTSNKKDLRLEEAVGREEVSKLIEGVEAEILSVKACKPISNGKWAFRREHINCKRRRKAERTIKDDELFSFYLRNRQRCATYVWKPGWIPEGSAYSTHNKKVKRSWRKFDGVHPWAPNL